MCCVSSERQPEAEECAHKIKRTKQIKPIEMKWQQQQQQHHQNYDMAYAYIRIQLKRRTNRKIPSSFALSLSNTHKRTHNRAHRNLTVAYVITETTKINILHAKYHSDIPTFVIFLLYMGFVTDAMRYTMLLPMMMMILLKCSWKLCALHDEHHSFQLFCVSRTMNNNSHNFKTIRVYFYWTISMVVRACRQNSPLKSILMSHHLPLIYSFF